MTWGSVVRALRGDRDARRRWVSSVFGKVGLAVEPTYHGLAAQRAAILSERAVGCVVDVGANTGQYATDIRSHGYEGPIVSFEANPLVTPLLQRKAALDPRWVTHGCALGAQAGRMPLNITVDSLSSSLLQPSDDRYAFMAPARSQPTVAVRTLDSFDLDAHGPLHIKLDVQGFELEVLRGAAATVGRAVSVECELSLTPLYRGQALIEDVTGLLRKAGFAPIGFHRGFTDPDSHYVQQVDGLFLRTTTPTAVKS